MTTAIKKVKVLFIKSCNPLCFIFLSEKFLLVNRSVSDPQRKNKLGSISSSKIPNEESIDEQNKLEIKMNVIQEVNSPQKSRICSQNLSENGKSSESYCSSTGGSTDADNHADLTYLKKGIKTLAYKAKI